MDREKELESLGWEKRFIACEPRLSEMAELYREIGFEVLIEPLLEEDEINENECAEKECRICYSHDREKYKIIYTRKKAT